ncbi:MAG TPA: RidA family protein [Thermoplasmataceae archaeon]|nr:RidA family protein [Thermoplasmatales archaeon AK]HLH86454.1 RidA family protein [Thermoplasmataceae archaeon]
MSGIRRIVVPEMGRGGPYSHAVVTDGCIYLSGQIGVSNTQDNSFRSQFMRIMDNISKIADSIGRSLSDTVKVTVYLRDPKYFNEMNNLFSEYFQGHLPARTTLVTGFPNPDALVEVDAVLA